MTLWDEIDKKDNIFKIIYCRVCTFFSDTKQCIKNNVQRLCNHGICDYDLWSLDHTMAKWILPRLKAFRKMKRFGYPGYFSEPPEPESKWGYSREQYDKLYAEGKIDPEVYAGKIKGHERWDQILDEMIYALDWKANYDFGNDQQQQAFIERWNLKNPHTKTDENKNISYIYEMTEKYLCEQEEKSPELKKFGGLAPELLSDEPDLHIKEPENYKFIKERITYYNVDYDVNVIGKRAVEGAKLIGKFWFSIWD